MKIRILVVEDEVSIRDGICDVLVYHGFEPDPVEEGTRGLERARSGEHGLLILDVMLPGMDGFELCRQLRARGSQLPVLMLTAKGSEADVVHGFECGADDYVTKPFSVRELVVRVNALLRRAGRIPAARFACGALQVDGERGVVEGEGFRAELSAREVAILGLLAREEGRIVSRRRLLQEVWGYQNAEQQQTRTVDMHIAKLRKKLDRFGALVETVRGQGYRVAERS